MTTMVGLYVEFKAKSNEVDAAFRRMEAEISKLKRANEGVNQSLEKTTNAAHRMGSSLTNYFKGFLTVTAVIGTLRFAEGQTRKFSAALAELSAITGATGKDLEYLNNEAQKLGSTTSSNAIQVAEAFKLVGSVKADLLGNLPALRQVTEQVITLSTASGVDLATAAKTVGSALNQFGADSKEAARFVNVLAAGSRFGAAEVDDLGESLKYVGPVASQVGLSFEETVAAIELLGQAGIKGSEAGTGLRQVLVRLAQSTDDNINPSVVGLSKALTNLRDKHMSVAESSEMFGLNALASGLALVKFSGQADAMTKSVTGTNTAMEQSDTIMNSYAGKVGKLSNAFTGLGIALGDSVSKNGVVDTLTESVNTLTESVRDYGFVLGTLKSIGNIQIDIGGKIIRSVTDTGDGGATKTTTRQDVDLVAAQRTRRRGQDLLDSGIDKTRSNYDMDIKAIIEGSFSSFDPQKFAAPLADSLDVMTGALAAASKKINKAGEDFLSNFVKNKGRDKLNSILDDGKEPGKGTPEIKNETWDNMIKAIYEKALNGTGGQHQTGYFNGKLIDNVTSTAAQDLDKLKSQIDDSSRGGNVTGMTGYIGAIDELAAFIKKIDPSNQKVNVSIEVKTEEGFLLKVAQSAEIEKAVQEKLSNLTSSAARMGAK